MNIQQRIEKKRGCGYRKPGGMYLVAGRGAETCCKLPFPLAVCPCCGVGIKQARGFTWINTDLFFPGSCTKPGGFAGGCPLSIREMRIGLMWVGEKYYHNAWHFTQEAIMQGISKRIAQIPREFEIGKTWIALAHPRGYLDYEIVKTDGSGVVDITQRNAAIFTVFKPTAIEYVVTGTEPVKKLEQLEKRGITLVRVIRDIDAQTSFV